MRASKMYVNISRAWLGGFKFRKWRQERRTSQALLLNASYQRDLSSALPPGNNGRALGVYGEEGGLGAFGGSE